MNPSCYLVDPIIELDGNAGARSYDGRRALLDRADHRNHIGASIPRAWVSL
jgi:hypothetical protein